MYIHWSTGRHWRVVMSCRLRLFVTAFVVAGGFYDGEATKTIESPWITSAVIKVTRERE